MTRLCTYMCIFCACVTSGMYGATSEDVISTGSNNTYIEQCDTYEKAYIYAQSFDNKATCDTWPQALNFYLEAYALDPSRAEPFIRIAQHYCTIGKPKLAYFFAHHACQLTCPTNASVDRELYDFTRYDLLGITAWYVGSFEEGERAVRKALEYKPHEQYLKNNLKIYIEHRIRTNKKIVGLIPARNESKIIEQCLHALSLYTDAIVYLDDASDDNSLAIVESVASRYHVEKIIRKQIWKRDEPRDRNALLAAGREIGGTHFIVIDADEMLTANCYEHNWLRNQISELHPGDRLMLNWIHLWKSPYTYRTDEGWKYRYKDFAFCDDCLCSYNSEFIHTSRTPDNLSGKLHYTNGDSYGMLHFQFVNWQNVLKKQVWYKCLERIRTPDKPCDAINQRYAFSMDTHREQTSPVNKIWFDGYNFFDPTVFEAQEEWRAIQIKQWMHQYGIQHFYGLDFWGLDINTL